MKRSELIGGFGLVAVSLASFLALRPAPKSDPQRNTASESNARLDCPETLMRIAASDDKNRRAAFGFLSQPIDTLCQRSFFNSFDDSYELESFLAGNSRTSLGLNERFLSDGCFPATEIDAGWFQKRTLTPSERNSVIADYYLTMNRLRDEVVATWKLMAGTQSVLDGDARYHKAGNEHEGLLDEVHCNPLFPNTCGKLKQLQACPASSDAYKKIFRNAMRHINVILSYDKAIAALVDKKMCDRACDEISKMRDETLEAFAWGDDPGVRSAIDAFRNAYSSQRKLGTQVHGQILQQRLDSALRKKLTAIGKGLSNHYAELTYVAECVNGEEKDGCGSNDFLSLTLKQGARMLYDMSPGPKVEHGGPHVASAVQILDKVQAFDFDGMLSQMRKGPVAEQKRTIRALEVLNNAECRASMRGQMEVANITQQKFAFEASMMGLGAGLHIALQGLLVTEKGTVLIKAAQTALTGKNGAIFAVGEIPHVLSAGAETVAIVHECRELLEDVVEKRLPGTAGTTCAADPASVVVRASDRAACAAVAAQLGLWLVVRETAPHAPEIFDILKKLKP